VRGERFAVILALALAPDSWAEAGEHTHAKPTTIDHPPGLAPRPIDALAQQLADETAAIDRALAQVGDKLGLAEATRAKRLHAAYRLIHEAGPDAMATARGRAAAELLLAQDANERSLLADEATRLHTARDRAVAETAQLPTIALPSDLARPAHGKIARRFGTVEHERSKTTLSRRGIDIEVDDHADATAPAAGTIRYAGAIRGLDNGLIIDHGDYFTIIAKLGDLAVANGAKVARGDTLGSAARHRIYVEVRVKLGPGGLPIDPEPLFQ